MKTISILTAAIVGMTASIANAGPATTAEPAVAASASAAASAGADNRRYCVVDTQTGSRIPYKECRTRAEWKARGVDIDAK